MAEERGFWDGFFHELVYPALTIIGAGAIIAYTGGSIQFTPQKSTIPDAIAQQAPSRQEESPLQKMVREYPELFPKVEGYTLTPSAMEYIRDFQARPIQKFRVDKKGKVTEEPSEDRFPFRSALFRRAATIGGDSTITEAELQEANKQYNREVEPFMREFLRTQNPAFIDSIYVRSF